MDRERERRRWEEGAQRAHEEEDLAQARRDERVEVRAPYGRARILAGG